MPRTTRLAAMGLIASLMLAALVFLRPQPVAAAACVWGGTTSTAWADPANWTGCNGGVPAAGDSVTIGGGTNQPTLSANATIGALTVNNGSTLSIAAGTTLTTG